MQTRSAHLTNFWHCGGPHFSFRTGTERGPGNEPSRVLAENCASQGSGNADSQPNVRSSGGSGACRPSPGDSGCVTAHPASWRASASYRPLRAERHAKPRAPRAAGAKSCVAPYVPTSLRAQRSNQLSCLLRHGLLRCARNDVGRAVRLAYAAGGLRGAGGSVICKPGQPI